MRKLVTNEGVLSELRTLQSVPNAWNVCFSPVGTEAPAFSGNGLDHETISLVALRALGKPIVLIFTNPHCAPCSTLMSEIGRWQYDYADKLTIALISRGSVEDNRAKTSEHHLCRLVLQDQNEIDKLYDVHGTPSAVLIHPDGLLIAPSLWMGSSIGKSIKALRKGMSEIANPEDTKSSNPTPKEALPGLDKDVSNQTSTTSINEEVKSEKHAD